MALIVSQQVNQEGWDLTKIRNTFDETTTQLIQKIPLSWLAPKDCWIWSSNNSGEFSVKFAYWLSRNISPPTNQDAIHGLIWKSKIHERLKMHLWRIAANCLPTKACLARFWDLDDILCPLCKDAEESSLHLFISYPFTRAVWFNSQWGLRLENLNLNSPSHLIGVFLNPPVEANIEGIKRGEFLLFGVVICEDIWRVRNQAIFEGKETNPIELCQKFDKTIVEHRMSIAILSGFQLPKPVQRWKKPPRDLIKINVDAAFKDGNSSIAVFARDWRGEMVFACAKKVYSNLPLQAEAEAIK